MKKIYTLFLLSLFSSILSMAAPYGLLINGTTQIEATSFSETDHQGREQFLASCVALNQGDKVQLYDFASTAAWMCAIDPYGEYQKFTKNTDHLICNVAGSYDFYIKLKYEDDMLYIGPGENCGGNNTNPTPDPNASYYITGTENLVGADLAWKADAIKMTKDETSGVHSYTFTALAAGKDYKMKITNGTWNANWGYTAVKNNPNVGGDTDGNVVFALASASACLSLFSA